MVYRIFLIQMKVGLYTFLYSGPTDSCMTPFSVLVGTMRKGEKRLQFRTGTEKLKAELLSNSRMLLHELHSPLQ